MSQLDLPPRIPTPLKVELDVVEWRGAEELRQRRAGSGQLLILFEGNDNSSGSPAESDCLRRAPPRLFDHPAQAVFRLLKLPFTPMIHYLFSSCHGILLMFWLDWLDYSRSDTREQSSYLPESTYAKVIRSLSIHVDRHFFAIVF